MTDLLDLITEEAIDRVERNADEEWKRAAHLAVAAAAQRREQFTTDLVVEIMAERGNVSTHEPRAMGAVMRRAARLGVVAATDVYEQSRNPEAHKRPKRVWRSLVFRESS